MYYIYAFLSLRRKRKREEGAHTGESYHLPYIHDGFLPQRRCAVCVCVYFPNEAI